MTETTYEFLLKQGLSLFLFVLIGFVFFCCLLYLFGTLCDRQPKYSKYAVMLIWGFTLAQCIVYLFSGHFVVGLIGICHHLLTISAILEIPEIELFKPKFMMGAISSGVAQIVLIMYLFSGKFKFYEWVLIFFTYDLIVIFAVASMKFNGKRTV